jgi:hypothetical protein
MANPVLIVSKKLVPRANTHSPPYPPSRPNPSESNNHLAVSMNSGIYAVRKDHWCGAGEPAWKEGESQRPGPDEPTPKALNMESAD